jgi:lipid A 3-O-deacylase
MRHKIIAFLLVLFFSTQGKAQSDTSFLSKIGSARYISHDYENDFFDATDIYYTQGIRYELVLPYLKIASVGHALVRLKHDAKLYYGASLVQECYTPSSIRRDTVFTGDRPFASVAYTGRFLVSNDSVRKQRLTSEIDLGLIGPCAQCAEEQKAIHKALVNIQPLGWQYQISQDIILTYSVGWDKSMYENKYVGLIFQTASKVGTMYDNARAGLLIRSGRMLSYFESIAPGESREAKKLQVYGYVKGWAEGVGYNATMQGGLFDRKSIYTLQPDKIERLVYGVQYGLIFSWKKFSLQYSKVLISPEFKNGLSHGWGHCNITVAF